VSASQIGSYPDCRLKILVSLPSLSGNRCDENDAIATFLVAAFEMTEVAKNSPAVLHACAEPSEQSLKLFSLPGAQ
jgi:hypothetical protein